MEDEYTSLNSQPGCIKVVDTFRTPGNVKLLLSPRQSRGISHGINRALIEAGLITMKDSPNGKRYGKRNAKGEIVEAYGFDLSPIGARYAEFVRLAVEAKAERGEMRRLRRRATIASNGITQILETAAEHGCRGEEWTTLRHETCNLTQALRKVELYEEMALGLASLERRQNSARERLEYLLGIAESDVSKTVSSDPKGSENRPHQYTYEPSLHPEQDTVVAYEESGGAGGEIGAPERAPAWRGPPERGRVVKLAPDELVKLAPRLRGYLRRSDPTWPELVDAAAFLGSDLDVSKSLWGEACIFMGREQAAIAIAVVSTKAPDHFRTTAGGYFHGMVMKAKIGELNLDRTLWGMRRASEPSPAALVNPSSEGGQQRPLSSQRGNQGVRHSRQFLGFVRTTHAPRAR